MPKTYGADMTKMGCAIDGCPDQLHTSNLCSKHYQRWYRRKDTMTVGDFIVLGGVPDAERPGSDGKCAVNRCNKPTYSNRLCSRHHYRLRFPERNYLDHCPTCNCYERDV